MILNRSKFSALLAIAMATCFLAVSLTLSPEAEGVGFRPAPIAYQPRTSDHVCPSPSQFVGGEIPSEVPIAGLGSGNLRKGEYKTDPRTGGRVLASDFPLFPSSSAAALNEAVAYDASVVGIPASDTSAEAEAVRAAGLANVAARVKKVRAHHDMLHEQAVKPCLSWSGWVALQAEHAAADRAARDATGAFLQALTAWENKTSGGSPTR